MCASCGQERGALLIPDKVYVESDDLFSPMKGDLVLIPGEPIRACTRCVCILKKGMRPLYAIRIPNKDERFTEMSKLEFRLCRPILPVITVHQLPGGEGQYATTGGSVSFFNDSMRIAKRLPRPKLECGGVWIRNSKTTSSQITSETKVQPDKIRRVLAECIANKHPAFPGIELAEDNLAALASESTNVDAVIIDEAPPLETSEEFEEESDWEDDAPADKDTVERVRRERRVGPDPTHILLMDVPKGVDQEGFLRSLFGDDPPPSTPGEAEAQPGDPGMLTVAELQPRFSEQELVDELSLGRSVYMRIFIQHFTNGMGGFEQAPEALTEAEWLECCCFWHTRQFQLDIDFCAFACK